MSADYHVKLSQLVSYILRHAPGEYGLELDPDGWVETEKLLAAINTRSPFKNVAQADLDRIMAHSDKRRHEMAGDKIRAAYGHSLERKVERTPTEPPEILYHGTSHRFLAGILKNGLLPKSRQYVHLSRDRKTAGEVGLRRDADPVVLTISARLAWSAGHRFYQADEKIWLADTVPPEFIKA